MLRRSKNHHFVPKVLQKNFSINGKHLWFSERQNAGEFHPPELRNINKTFRKRDYYTVLEGDQRSDIVERDFYGKIDDYLGRELPKIMNTIASGNYPTFSGPALETLRLNVMQMAKRTPDFVKNHDDVEPAAHILKAAMKVANTGERQELNKILRDPERLRDFGRNARVRGTIQNTKRVEDALHSMSVRWGVIEGNHSFVLSSKVVLWLGNGGPNGLMNPLVEIWMPISPKVSLILFRDKQNIFPVKNVIHRDFVRRLNEYASENSTQIASHSRQLLASLISRSA